VWSGGVTELTRTVYGARGRLSTDLDFTCRTDISIDDLTLALLDATPQIEQDYFRLLGQPSVGLPRLHTIDTEPDNPGVVLRQRPYLGQHL